MAPQFEATQAESGPDPNEKLVKIFDTEQESEAMVVKGLLDSAGIESDLKSGSLVQEAFPGLGGMLILVREEDAEKARRLIVESQQQAAVLDVASPAIAATENKDEDDDDATEELKVME